MRKITCICLLLALLAPAPVARAAEDEVVDDACTAISALECGTYYADRDGDGYGDPNTEHRSTRHPKGTTTRAGDCDDTDAWVNPEATETFDGRDEDCDGEVDAVLVATELMVNPDAVADTSGEYVEVTNTSPSGIDLTGVTVSVGSRTCDLEGVLGGGEATVLARSADPETNGGFLPDVVCSLTLTNSGTTVFVTSPVGSLDVVDYTTFTVPVGASLNLDPSSTDPVANDDAAAWCPATTPLPSGDTGTPGTSNDHCEETA